jgi:hypothetical protein
VDASCLALGDKMWENTKERRRRENRDEQQKNMEWRRAIVSTVQGKIHEALRL